MGTGLTLQTFSLRYFSHYISFKGKPMISNDIMIMYKPYVTLWGISLQFYYESITTVFVYQRCALLSETTM